MKVKDPYSGEYFIRKRRNQIYASRANQIAFNNRKYSKEKERMTSVLFILQRNRKILKTYLGSRDNCHVSKEYLDGAGYDFRYFTNANLGIKNENFFVFEFGIINLGEDEFQVFRDKNYMTK